MPIVKGNKVQIGWGLIPEDAKAADVDWEDVQTFCTTCKPQAGGDFRLIAIYEDDFKGDKLVCENCRTERPFSPK